MNRNASVTMKEGSRVRMTIWPLIAAEHGRRHEGGEDRGKQREAGEQQKGAEDQAREGHHRADREIEFAADHQQRRGDGQDAELRRRRQDVHDAREGEHRRVGGGQEEERDEDEARGGAEFRPAHQPRGRAMTFFRRSSGAVPIAAAGSAHRLFEMRHARLHRDSGKTQPADDPRAARHAPVI